MKKCILTLMALTIVGAIIANSRLLSATSFFTNETEANEPTNVATSPALAAEDETVDSIAAAIVTRSDVDLTFTNDETYPWTINGNEIKNGNCGKSNSTSTLTLSYKSNYTTEFYYGCTFKNYSNHFRTTYVDGKIITSQRFFIEPGEHVIVFKDSIGNSTSTSNYYYITNLWVKEIQPLETAVLSENSQPLTFKNDGEWPWTIEDGYIQNTNYGHSYSASTFSTTFKIDKASKFSFEKWVNRYDSDPSYASTSHNFISYINGVRYWTQYYTPQGWQTECVLLEPGEYTLTFSDTIFNTTTTYYSRIRNIELSSNWIDVELSSPGTLGVEVLYKVNVLKDVELLKVKGTLNETDWTNINQMKNLIGLDLTEAKFDVVPEKAFYGLSKLSNVKLPEGVKTIGASAFVGTQLLNIDIPSSVTSIGTSAFSGTMIRTVNFKENSQLQSIGYNAFYQCTSLQEFIMPNTVTNLNINSYYQYSDIFYGCTNLKKLIFSDAITSLPKRTCYGCSAIRELHLPKNLETIEAEAFYQCSKLRKIEFPSSLRAISSSAFYQCGLDSVCLPLKLSSLGQYAFQDCDSLKYVELPSYIGTYSYDFYGCGSIQTIVCPSATPPAISNDPFSNGRAKSAITLKVPSFAVVNYKLDTYWYQFGSIVEGDDIDYWKITSELSLTNNRRMNGNPDIDLYYGGKLRVGGNAPMPTAVFNYYVSEGNPGCLINDCPDMTAENLCTKFSVSANTWYFLTPVHDVVLNQVTHSANASYVFRYYDGASRGTNGTGSSWKNVEDGGTLKAGQGYIFQCNAAGVITLPAEAAVHEQLFNTEDVTTPLYTYESTSTANMSWNYVGNPFPTYFDVYYMDFTAPITVWTGSTYKAYSIVDDEFVLRPMQSFFVQKPEEVENIVFHKEGRQFSSAIERASYAPARSGQPAGNRLLFNLQIVNSENAADETRVVINEAAKMSYEISSDASKFTSMEKGMPQLFTIDDEGNRYAINERPLNDGNVQMGFYAPESGYYTIQALRADGEVTLYDTALGKSIDITSEAYTFHSKAGNDVSRFVLIFNASLLEPTAIGHASTDEVNVSTLPGQIVVNAAKGTSIAVYNIGGEIIYEGTLNSPSLTIDTPTGAYIVKAGNRSYKTVISQ